MSLSSLLPAQTMSDTISHPSHLEYNKKKKKICVDFSSVTWISTRSASLSPLSHLAVCTLPYLLTSLPATTLHSLTFLWRWSSNRWGHSPTESLENTNRANDWFIWVSETGAIDRGRMQYLATCCCAGLFFWQYVWKAKNKTKKHSTHNSIKSWLPWFFLSD